ncbi:MAG: asparagine synthase (glutamine-hydrolyzing) [Acidobacteriota bacterium]|nr:asparagine synthase (glutamine-hydrolyzing) [Acidobacteriota bacterium]
MCGICGIARSPQGESVSREILEAMCGTLVHRGPDDGGVHVEAGAGLGSRRLAIIDVDGGRMPMANEDGRIWITHNGEVYNFLELREELEGRGHIFKTRTDTEAVLHGYEEWGRDVVRRMRGMFATAVWDGRDKSLTLFRDRIGIKPLYYTQIPDGSLVFGSELKAVVAHPGVRRELEPEALDIYLTVEYVPAPLSMFKNIYKLPAGHMLIYEKGRIRVERYWDIPEADAAAEKPMRRLEDIQDELYALLKEAVRMRLVSDVPLGAFLSGGIDSSAVVGMMRELGASPLKTFSIGFKDQSYNELEHARRIAQKFETEHEEFICEPQALELTEKLIRHLDEPLGDFSIFPTYLVSKMAREQVTVALSGDGGDEVFGGYEHYLAQKIARRFGVGLAARAAWPLLRRIPPASKKKGAWNKMRRFAQGFDHPAAMRHMRWMMFLSLSDKTALYTPDFAGRAGGPPDLSDRESFRTVLDKAGRLDTLNGELYIDLMTYLSDNILVKVDRMSMAPSLEARVPLLDHKVVEFAFSLPGDMKLRGMTTKWIFKKTLERLLPHETLYRAKEGFSIPIKHWLREDLRGLVTHYLDFGRIRAGGLFRPEAVQTMVEAHREGRENFSHQLWALLVFEMWREAYLK